MKRSDINILIAVTLVLTAIILRVAGATTHLYNFAPLAAIGLFSGAVVKDKKVLAFLIPLAGQFIADVYFQFFTNTPGFYPGQFFNYAALAAAAGLGLVMRQAKPVNVLLYIFGASTLFFIVSNLGYFAAGYNGYTIQGLVKTYIDAVPFFRNTMLGDLLGGVFLFGGYFIAEKMFVKKAKQAKA